MSRWKLWNNDGFGFPGFTFCLRNSSSIYIQSGHQVFRPTEQQSSVPPDRATIKCYDCFLGTWGSFCPGRADHLSNGKQSLTQPALSSTLGTTPSAPPCRRLEAFVKGMHEVGLSNLCIILDRVITIGGGVHVHSGRLHTCGPPTNKLTCVPIGCQETSHQNGG